MLGYFNYTKYFMVHCDVSPDNRFNGPDLIWFSAVPSVLSFRIRSVRRGGAQKTTFDSNTRMHFGGSVVNHNFPFRFGGKHKPNLIYSMTFLCVK